MANITTRAGKGAPLSWSEADANFINLNTDKVETINPTSSGTLTHSGDIVLSGSGKRITGDFSNAMVANRMMFQTSTVNGATSILAAPNGTATQSVVAVVNAADPTNASLMSMTATATETSVRAGTFGTGTYLPMTFHTGGSERMRIDTSGNVLVTSSGGLGYGTGSGGTVTQATSKSTAVTLNKPTGKVVMSNAALAAGATATFLLNNTLITEADVVVVSIDPSTTPTLGVYQVWATNGYQGCFISLRNNNGVSLSDSVAIQFAIIKGATA